MKGNILQNQLSSELTVNQVCQESELKGKCMLMVFCIWNIKNLHGELEDGLLV